MYPLPRIEDMLDTIGQAKYFSTWELSAGYWLIKLDPSASEKTAFTTHCGLFEFTRMTFGLCNVPLTFQQLMQKVLAGFEWKCCFVYIDDILVCSTTFEEHIDTLSIVVGAGETFESQSKAEPEVMLIPKQVCDRTLVSLSPGKDWLLILLKLTKSRYPLMSLN